MLSFLSRPLLLIAPLWLVTSTAICEELALNDELRKEISPLVSDFHAIYAGEKHRDIDELIAEDALFEEADSPLREYLQRVENGRKKHPFDDVLNGDKAKELTPEVRALLEKARREQMAKKKQPAASEGKLYWGRVAESQLLRPLRVYPRLKPEDAIIVTRELDRKPGKMKALGCVLQRFDGVWKIVFVLEGWGPEEQIIDKSVPFELHSGKG